MLSPENIAMLHQYFFSSSPNQNNSKKSLKRKFKEFVKLVRLSLLDNAPLNIQDVCQILNKLDPQLTDSYLLVECLINYLSEHELSQLIIVLQDTWLRQHQNDLFSASQDTTHFLFKLQQHKYKNVLQSWQKKYIESIKLQLNILLFAENFIIKDKADNSLKISWSDINFQNRLKIILQAIVNTFLNKEKLVDLPDSIKVDFYGFFCSLMRVENNNKPAVLDQDHEELIKKIFCFCLISILLIPMVLDFVNYVEQKNKQLYEEIVKEGLISPLIKFIEKLMNLSSVTEKQKITNTNIAFYHNCVQTEIFLDIKQQHRSATLSLLFGDNLPLLSRKRNIKKERVEKTIRLKDQFVIQILMSDRNKKREMRFNLLPSPRLEEIRNDLLLEYIARNDEEGFIEKLAEYDKADLKIKIFSHCTDNQIGLVAVLQALTNVNNKNANSLQKASMLLRQIAIGQNFPSKEVNFFSGLGFDVQNIQEMATQLSNLSITLTKPFALESDLNRKTNFLLTRILEFILTAKSDFVDFELKSIQEADIDVNLKRVLITIFHFRKAINLASSDPLQAFSELSNAIYNDKQLVIAILANALEKPIKENPFSPKLIDIIRLETEAEQWMYLPKISDQEPIKNLSFAAEAAKDLIERILNIESRLVVYNMQVIDDNIAKIEEDIKKSTEQNTLSDKLKVQKDRLMFFKLLSQYRKSLQEFKKLTNIPSSRSKDHEDNVKAFESASRTNSTFLKPYEDLLKKEYMALFIQIIAENRLGLTKHSSQQTMTRSVQITISTTKNPVNIAELLGRSIAASINPNPVASESKTTPIITSPLKIPGKTT